MSVGLLLLIAVLQGLTEFLPVSSSGHLTLAAEWFGLQLDGTHREAFFVLLHVASLLATVWWLRHDLVALVREKARRREIIAIVIGVLPAAVTGLVLKLQGSGALFESLPLVAVGWMVTAALLVATRWGHEQGWTLAGAWPLWAIVAVGCAQALAIVPGISRSGATIAVALLCGMVRPEAFRFSFLISLPVIAGATVLNLPLLPHVADVAGFVPLACAFLLCLAVSLVALAFLQRVVLARWLHGFAPYCVALAIVAYVLSR